MDIFIFTYEKDAPLLPLCLSHAVAHGRVVVVDQADAPATNEAEALALGAAEYTRTSWDRGGNLNGAACVRGMLETYAAHGTDEWVMQVDSNLLLFRPEVLLEGTEAFDMVGQCSGRTDAARAKSPLHWVSGGGMLLRRRMLAPMLARLEDPKIVERIEGGRRWSDMVLTALCRMCGGRVQLYSYEAAPVRQNVYRRISWHTFDAPELNCMCQHSAAVHVSPRGLAGETPEERNVAVLAAMEELAATWQPLPS